MDTQKLASRLGRRSTIIAAASAAFAIANGSHTANAAEIGFHFTAAGPAISATTDAGAVQQLGSTWNNLNVNANSYGTFSQTNPGGTNWTDTNFIDSNGTTISSMSVSYGGTNNFFTNGTADYGAGFTGSAADKGLFTGYIGNNNATNSSNSEATVTIKGIPYSSYNIYVYFSSNEASAATYEAIDASVGGSGLTFYNTGSMAAQTGYTLDTSTISTAPTAADYAVFSEVGASTGGTDVIAFSFLNGNVNAIHVYGMQIVDTSVPEPSSAALLGVGAVALLRRRRGMRACAGGPPAI